MSSAFSAFESQWRLAWGRSIAAQAGLTGREVIEWLPPGLDWLFRELPPETPGVHLRNAAFLEALAEGLARHQEPVRSWLLQRLRRSLRNASLEAVWLRHFAETLETECYVRYWEWLERQFQSPLLPAGTRQEAIEALFAGVGVDGLMSRACAWNSLARTDARREVNLPGETVVKVINPGKPIQPALIRRGIPIDWRDYAEGRFPADAMLLDIRRGIARATCLIMHCGSAWHPRVLHLTRGASDMHGRLLDSARAACAVLDLGGGSGRMAERLPANQ